MRPLDDYEAVCPSIDPGSLETIFDVYVINPMPVWRALIRMGIRHGAIQVFPPMYADDSHGRWSLWHLRVYPEWKGMMAA